jgi:hypothetical protein
VRRAVAALLALALASAVVTLRARQRPAPDPNRWGPAMQKFEAQDKSSPSPGGEIVFTGASSIVR